MGSIIPKHVAIIPDGNRRWAREKGFEPWKGHELIGKYENLKGIIKEAKKIGIKYLSAWGFSTENWKRSRLEKEILFKIFEKLVEDSRQDAHKERMRLIHVGRKDRLPDSLIKKIKKLEEETKNYNDFYLILCLDYGGRDEILRAINRAVKEGKKITEENFLSYLDTTEIPDPDLIIRTGGDKRLSGFMPFQSVYSELYFLDKYFPDFGPAELRKAVREFQRREQRHGE